MQPLLSLVDQLAPVNVVEVGSAVAPDGRADDLARDATRFVRIDDTNRRDLATVLRRAGAASEWPLDLAIDHRAGGEEPSVVTVLEVLLPIVRPGGLYVVEGAVPRRVVLALMLSTIGAPGVVAEVTVGPAWLAVRRGHDEAGSFELERSYTDPLEILG